MAPPTNDSLLAPGQKLVEHWEVEFEGKDRRSQKPYRYVEARLRRWYHNTYYGGSGGEGETVDEARLAMVLSLARAICNDGDAFQHDADDIFRGEMLRWFQGKIQEYDDYLELEDLTDKQARKTKRRIRLLEQLTAEWQEDYDYWPEEDDAPDAQVARAGDRRAAHAALTTGATTASTTD